MKYDKDDCMLEDLKQFDGGGCKKVVSGDGGVGEGALL